MRAHADRKCVGLSLVMMMMMGIIIGIGVIMAGGGIMKIDSPVIKI